MRILIIEDEHYAAKRIQNLILEQLPDAKLYDVIDTVEDAVLWLSSHVEPNLIFMDIQLADGLSFQIFDKVKVSCPIIFTTAYDEYALSAFKVNSIDYLLKPIEKEALRSAINKYQQFFSQSSSSDFNWQNITKEIFTSKNKYKQRFLIKTGNAYSYLNADEIKMLFSEDGLSFAYNLQGKKIMLEGSLDKIYEQLNPNSYYKISRKHIIALDAIKKVHPYLNNRLKVEIDQDLCQDLIVSREKVKDFKTWLDS